MSLTNSNVSKFILKSDSIRKIIDKAIKDVKFYEEMKNCEMTKCFQPLYIIFKLTIHKLFNCNIIEWQLISSDSEKYPPTDIVTPRIFNKRKNTDFETQTDIIIELSADLTMENETEILILAQKSGLSVRNLFTRFRFANKLIIYNQNQDKKVDDNFLLLVIEKIRTKNLKYLSPIPLYNILTFISKYDINKHNIFYGKPGLKEFTIYIEYSKILENKLIINDKLWRFIDSVSENNIQLKLTFDQNEESILLTISILKYCKNNNINVLVDVENDKLLFFNHIKQNISDKKYELVKNLSSITFVINQLEDLEYIKYVFTQMNNLEEIKIIFNKIIYPKFTESTNQLEIFWNFYHKVFNFKTQIQKVKSFTLKYYDNYYPKFFETFIVQEKLYDMFVTFILSILPNSLTQIQFVSMPYLKEEYFDYLYKSTPNLIKISFKHCHYIPEDVLIGFKNLKNVHLADNVGITIPSWVEIVMYKDFNDFMCGNYFIPHLKKSKWRFYKLMKNSTFKNTFWIGNNHIPDTVIFMKDVLKWKDAIELLHL